MKNFKHVVIFILNAAYIFNISAAQSAEQPEDIYQLNCEQYQLFNKLLTPAELISFNVGKQYQILKTKIIQAKLDFIRNSITSDYAVDLISEFVALKEILKENKKLTQKQEDDLNTSLNNLTDMVLPGGDIQ